MRRPNLGLFGILLAGSLSSDTFIPYRETDEQRKRRLNRAADRARLEKAKRIAVEAKLNAAELRRSNKAIRKGENDRKARANNYTSARTHKFKCKTCGMLWNEMPFACCGTSEFDELKQS